MRVLGVDPGLTRCGFAIVEGVPGKNARLIQVGVIKTEPKQLHAERLLAVAQGLESLIDVHRPEAVAVEAVFSQHNLRSVIGTAQASGVAMYLAAKFGLPVATHTPTEIKAAVTGSGRATKEQVSNMVVKILGLTTKPTPADATDACALALCHVWRGGMQARLIEARERFVGS